MTASAEFRPQGVITALVTSFEASGKLDETGLAASVEYQIRAGVHGLCPTGGTGEPLSLTEEEHRRALDVVLEAAGGRVPVIAGVLLANQEAVIRLALHAKASGAAAVMVIPPYFVRTHPENVARHFAEIARAIDHPLILFNTPSRSGVNLPARWIADLARRVPVFVGVKESSGNLTQVGMIIREAPEGFTVLQGSDALQLPTYAMGGTGGIVALANLVPGLFVELHQAVARGDIARAQDIQLRLLPLDEVCYSEGHPAPLKRALELVGRPAGPTRPPIYPVSLQTEARLREVLKGLGLAIRA